MKITTTYSSLITSFCALLSLSACDDGTNLDRSLLEELKLEWTALPDGSFFARNHISNGGMGGAYRCWQVDTGYECIHAYSPDNIGINSLNVERVWTSELPDEMLPVSSPSGGYSCDKIGPYNVENIRRGKEVLITNRPGQTAAWDRSFVNQYMTANEVDGPRYYPCLEILRSLSRGSLETLSTTDVNSSSLGEPIGPDETLESE